MMAMLCKIDCIAVVAAKLKGLFGGRCNSVGEFDLNQNGGGHRGVKGKYIETQLAGLDTVTLKEQSRSGPGRHLDFCLGSIGLKLMKFPMFCHFDV